MDLIKPLRCKTVYIMSEYNFYFYIKNNLTAAAIIVVI